MLGEAAVFAGERGAEGCSPAQAGVSTGLPINQKFLSRAGGNLIKTTRYQPVAFLLDTFLLRFLRFLGSDGFLAALRTAFFFVVFFLTVFLTG